MKRSRGAAFGGDDARIKRAIAINAKLRSKYPYKEYGVGYFKRGTPANLERFGASYRTANELQREMRKDLGYSGRGMYMGGKGGYWGRKIGGLFGKAALGDKLGDIGSSLISQFVPGGSTAMMAARAAGKVFEGRGMYNAVNNSLVKGGDPIPSFVVSPDGSTITITHREYIGDVYAPPSGDVFQNTPYSVNPGIERTFPWLSQIASNYDEYTLHQCMFSFRSTVADFASASGQVGQVIMATIYNASADPFGDKAQMMQYDASMSCKTSESMIHGVECDPAKLSGPVGRFVRSNPVLIGQDVNNYDHGLFNIAVTETPSTYANQAMGELWVSYTVQLRKPKFFTNRGLGISRDVFASVAGQSSYAPFGLVTNPDSTLYGQQNNIGGKLTRSDLTQTIPVGLPGLSVNQNNTPDAPSVAGQVAAFSYTLPANYAGNLRIVWRNTNNNPATHTYWVYGQGNISAIRDVLADGSDQWISAGCGNTGARVSTQWVDIRVDVATNGTENVVYFVPDTSGASIPITNCFLDISEYNHGLSYKQDGTRDQLILVDASGTVQNI